MLHLQGKRKLVFSREPGSLHPVHREPLYSCLCALHTNYQSKLRWACFHQYRLPNLPSKMNIFSVYHSSGSMGKLVPVSRFIRATKRTVVTMARFPWLLSSHWRGSSGARSLLPLQMLQIFFLMKITMLQLILTVLFCSYYNSEDHAFIFLTKINWSIVKHASLITKTWSSHGSGSE